MNKTASISSPNHSSPPLNGSLHPTLKAALGSLNIQLDEELARYRRRRRAQGASIPGASFDRQSPASRQTGKSLDLQLLNTVGKTTQTSPPPPPTSPKTTAKPYRDPTAPGGTMSNAATPVEAVVVQPATRPITPPDDRDTRSIEPGLILATDAAELSAQVTPPHLVDPNAEADPYSYFESSEELLRSLSEEEGHPPVRPSRSWFNPLGIGSILLLFLTSASLGYVLMNTLKSRQLGVQQAATPTNPNPQQPLPTTLPNSPDLTAKEFVDLNLNTLGTLPSDSGAAVPSPSLLASPQPNGFNKTVAASPNAELKPGAVNAAKTAAAPPKQPVTSSTRTVNPVPPVTAPPSVSVPIAPIQPVQSIPARSAPPRSAVVVPPRPTAGRSASPTRRNAAARPTTSTPSQAAGVPASAPSTNSAPKYRVVVPFNGDQTLEEVRQTDPRAFVRNSSEGAKIQVGAYEDEANARQRVQELQQKGIEAQIVPR